VLVQALTEEPALKSVEWLHRARLAGYTGGKSAVNVLAQTLRVRTVTPLVRFGGFDAFFTTAAALIADLSAAFRAGELAQALPPYTHPAVLIVD
jgi:hypothetical protein